MPIGATTITRRCLSRQTETTDLSSRLRKSRKALGSETTMLFLHLKILRRVGTPLLRIPVPRSASHGRRPDWQAPVHLRYIEY